MKYITIKGLNIYFYNISKNLKTLCDHKWFIWIKKPNTFVLCIKMFALIFNNKFGSVWVFWRSDDGYFKDYIIRDY